MRTIVAFGIAMMVLMAVGVIAVEFVDEHPMKDLFQRPAEQARGADPSEGLQGMPIVVPRTLASEV